MKFGTKRTNPVIGTEIQFKFLHWVSTLQATTPQPEPLFIPKQDRRTSFMMPNHPMVWNLYLVQVGFPPFWQSFCWFSSREMEFLTNYWVFSLHFCCKYIYSSKVFESSGAISSYLLVLSLIVASWGAHTQFTFQKYAFFRPSSTPSGAIQCFYSATTRLILQNTKKCIVWLFIKNAANFMSRLISLAWPY